MRFNRLNPVPIPQFRAHQGDPSHASSAPAEGSRQRPGLQSIWREARDLVWQHRGRIGIGLLLIFVNSLASLVPPASTKYVVDDVIGKHRSDLLLPVVLAVLAAALVQAATSFTLSQLLSVTAQRAITDMRKTVQQHVTRLPVRFFDSTKSGVLISRVMTDAEGVRNLVGTGLVQILGGSIKIIFALSVLFYLNWRLTTIVLAVLLLFGGIVATAFRRLRPLFRRRGEINAQVSGRLAETLGGIRIVKAYTAEKREDRIFAHGVHELYRNVRRTITATSTVTAAGSLIVGGVSALMMYLGGRAILNGSMTLGEVFSYFFFVALVAAPIIQLSSIGTQLPEAFAGLDRIRELRQLTTEEDEDAERQDLGPVTGEVEFQGVGFEYTPGVPVLHDVHFTAPAGTTTALVGSSGSGKSTLISLVMAFNRPTTGRILVDGKDLASVRLHQYRSRLGIVMQDNFLFDGTVAENIAYSKPHATRDEIREVSRIAHSDVFVEAFTDGYDTVVGERGVKLSGGQRQRIAIARAILADPAILILDEATSSLDSESEALIQDGLQALRAGRTTFVIAHRLSTIQSADQILVLEAGRIVERGSHDELLALDGRYRELYDKQYKLERNRFINPGEDFTPEPPPRPTAAAGSGSGRGSRDL